MNVLWLLRLCGLKKKQSSFFFDWVMLPECLTLRVQIVAAITNSKYLLFFSGPWYFSVHLANTFSMKDQVLNAYRTIGTIIIFYTLNVDF